MVHVIPSRVIRTGLNSKNILVVNITNITIHIRIIYNRY